MYQNLIKNSHSLMKTSTNTCNLLSLGCTVIETLTEQSVCGISLAYNIDIVFDSTRIDHSFRHRTTIVIKVHLLKNKNFVNMSLDFVNH